MLDRIIRLSLKYRLLVVVISLALLLYGAYATTTLPIDVFPDLDRPRVVVLTECPGLAPEEVETLVTTPIETALLGANGVEAVRSQSAVGLTVIYIEFNWQTDIRIARQIVQERLTTVLPLMPPGIRPQMAPISSIMGQIMHIGLYRQPGPGGGELAPLEGSDHVAELRGEPESGTLKIWQVTDRNAPATWEELRPEAVSWLSPEEGERARVRLVLSGKEHEAGFATIERQQLSIRTLADWVVRPSLQKIPGIAEVIVMGGDRKQYQVLLDPESLHEYGISVEEVREVLERNNLNTSGGFAVQGESERPIRVLGRLGPGPEAVLAELRQLPVKVTQHRTITLAQLATVQEGPQQKRGDASINGYPGVVITIVKQPHTDTRGLTERVNRALEAAERSLPADVVVNTELFQLKRFIDRGVYNVAEALAIGATLVLIVLFLFLLNFRTTFISLTAIPLSLVITTLVFKLISTLTGTELSINVMTLGGIAVALGELVDDAIVDVENIFRRLRENHTRQQPLPAIQVVYQASREIRSAIVYGTLVVILVFLPLFALSGVEGRLFAPLGVAYIVSILASLLVSLTVTPVLSYYLLPQAQATLHKQDGPLLRTLKRMAAPLVELSMAKAKPLLVITWVLALLSAWQMTRLGANFLPEFDEGSVQINMNLPPGSSLEASNRAAVIVDQMLQALQPSRENPDGEVLTFVRRTGRAELDEHAQAVSASEYILSMNPESGRSREEVIGDLLTDLKHELPGVDVEVEQPLAHLISHMLSGVYAQIAVKIYGDDLDVLRQSAERIKQVIATVPGVTEPVIEAQQEAEELHIRLRPADLAFHGLSRAHVAEFLATALQGEVVSQVLEGQRRFDLLVRLDESSRTDYTALGRLRVRLPDNRGDVLLGEIADIETGLGPNALNRENVRRRIVIRLNTQGRDLASAVDEIQQRIAKDVRLPEGYAIEYSGQFESQERATALITILAGLSVIGMFVVLLVLFPSVRIVLQILNALPTAFIGGVLALTLTGQTLTVASLVGFISLGGIAVRNGILLVSHYVHLMREEGESFSPEMVLRGSLERLAPVLMTALTAGIGLLPLVIGGEQPGREILYPVATVILGGLITSTFCEFLIHPGIFWRFSGKDADRVSQEHEEELRPAELVSHAVT